MNYLFSLQTEIMTILLLNFYTALKYHNVQQLGRKFLNLGDTIHKWALGIQIFKELNEYLTAADIRKWACFSNHNEGETCPKTV